MPPSLHTAIEIRDKYNAKGAFYITITLMIMILINVKPTGALIKGAIIF